MAEKNVRILHDDCFKSYADSMQKVVNETERFVSFDILHQLHEENTIASLSKVSGEALKHINKIQYFRLLILCLNYV